MGAPLSNHLARVELSGSSIHPSMTSALSGVLALAVLFLSVDLPQSLVTRVSANLSVTRLSNSGGSSP